MVVLNENLLLGCREGGFVTELTTTVNGELVVVRFTDRVCEEAEQGMEAPTASEQERDGDRAISVGKTIERMELA